MARTRREASFGEHGLLPFRRHLECAVEVKISFDDVERATRICLAQLVTDSLASGTARRPESVASVRRGARLLRVAVDTEVSSVPRREGAVGHLHWHARRLRRFFPVLEADLQARPLPSGRTRLVLDATYRPPAGLLGVVGDVLLGRVIARSTAEAFTGHLARAMEDAVEVGRCSGPAAAVKSREVTSKEVA